MQSEILHNGDTLHYTAVPNDPKQVPQKGTCTLSKPDSNGHTSKGYEGQVIPKETELSVIARTKTKAKVQKWENYWYYVEKRSHNLVADWITSCGPGWVYGDSLL
ncbi:MAG TPA: hypothetical protein PK453_08530 [Leptospiraceae bacterium]|nr:hypothetical protein [Leptospiraceae bacterium]HMY67357.1 hypothetical protein [Leptospiraceae bacterium]HNF13700.1 hypothetical protein [Leptospiraceae bacterium]HNF27295.1 hypothetical protein [Leptospiraceae bacterium]HNH07572.1 hypothetical protein [Leptospiraceae bacterium]